jgi:PAS domain S-box-containing protein
MKTKRKPQKSALRERAEEFLTQHPQAFKKISSKDLQALIHDLQVHQVELEMQNEELRIKQVELEESRNRYLDLYEFAPVGYLIFDRKGRIAEVNLTGTKLLGLPRSKAVGRPFTRYLSKESSPRFLRHILEVFAGSTKQSCELVLNQGPAKTIRYVSLESIVLGAGHNAKARSAVIDTTERKLAEEEVLRTRQELAEANERLQHLSMRLLEVQEEERRRLANEVHDTFTSSLAAIRYKLSSLLIDSKNKQDMEEVLNQLVALIDDARSIQRSLRPSVLDDLGLVVALNALCKDFRKSNPIISLETEFRIEENEIREPIKIQIFRITQEALNNIARHSGAGSAMVSLAKGDSSSDLVVWDKGRGFDVKEALSRASSLRGLGLPSMKERATLSGGAFRIESAPGKGTTLRVSWPLT